MRIRIYNPHCRALPGRERTLPEEANTGLALGRPGLEHVEDVFQFTTGEPIPWSGEEGGRLAVSCYGAVAVH